MGERRGAYDIVALLSALTSYDQEGRERRVTDRHGMSSAITAEGNKVLVGSRL